MQSAPLAEIIKTVLEYVCIIYILITLKVQSSMYIIRNTEFRDKLILFKFRFV